MRQIFFKLSVALLSVLSIACERQSEVELDLPPHEGELIVECYLEPGKPYRALVSRSVDFFESEKLDGVNGAVVKISSPEGPVELSNFVDADTLYKKVFNYGHQDSVKYAEGAEYQLTVEIDGKLSVSGRAKFLPKVSFGGYHYKYGADTMAALFLGVDDNPSEENYYRLVLRGTQPEYGTTYDELFSDKDFNGRLDIHTPYILKDGWTVVVNLYHIDQTYYNFLKSVKKARDTNYNPFMQPASLESGVEGGEGTTGIFTALSLTSDTVRIPPR